MRPASDRCSPASASEPEDRIALALLDTVDFPVIFWGAIHAGVIPVLFNTRLTVAQYRYLLEDSRAKAIFVSPAVLPDVQAAAQGVSTLRKIIVVGGGPQEHTRFDHLLESETPGEAGQRPAATRWPTGCTPPAPPACPRA